MDSSDLSGSVLDDRYKVLEEVSRGAMGVVYRAERLKLGKIVAVKVLHDELPDELNSRKRFEIEAMAMAKLEHPNCAAVLDVGVHDGRPFVVMDFISGTDLKHLVDAGPLPVPRAIAIVRQVLAGLAHAHEIGIVHRDIKPANIMLSHKVGLGDHVKVLDFGLARLQAEQTVSRLTTGIVVGTPAYMAPEQIRGKEIDARADLYACGVLLFELVTGAKPFTSPKDDPIEVVSMHLKQQPPLLADMLPGVEFAELQAVVTKALQKDAKDRFQSATDMVDALDVAQKAIDRAEARANEPRDERASDEPSAPISDSMMIPQGGTRLGVEVYPASPPHGVRSAHVPLGPQANIATSPVGHRVTKPLGFPLSSKQLGLIGGGVLALLVVGLIASRSGKAAAVATPAEPPTEIEMTVETPDPVQAQIDKAQQLIDQKRNDEAIDVLSKARVVFPENAVMPYMAGKLYFAKLWWSDGLRSFRDALRLDPDYRTDTDLIKVVLKAFITTPSYDRDIAAFLREDIGTPVEPYLEETARDHPNAAIRKRAADELRRFQP